MLYDWDNSKAATNLAKHGVAFEAVVGIEWSASLIRATLNHQGGEPRLLAFVPIGELLHALVYSVETRCVRVISLRRASQREVKFYASEN